MLVCPRTDGHHHLQKKNEIKYADKMIWDLGFMASDMNTRHKIGKYMLKRLPDVNKEQPSFFFTLPVLRYPAMTICQTTGFVIQ